MNMHFLLFGRVNLHSAVSRVGLRPIFASSPILFNSPHRLARVVQGIVVFVVLDRQQNVRVDVQIVENARA